MVIWCIFRKLVALVHNPCLRNQYLQIYVSKTYLISWYSNMFRYSQVRCSLLCSRPSCCNLSIFNWSKKRNSWKMNLNICLVVSEGHLTINIACIYDFLTCFFLGTGCLDQHFELLCRHTVGKRSHSFTGHPKEEEKDMIRCVSNFIR